MRLKVRHDGETYLFGARAAGDMVLSTRTVLDRDEAHRFFRQVAADPEIASQFRRAALSTRGRVAHNGESHDAFLWRIARELASGDLPVSVVYSPRSNWATVAIEAPRATPLPPSAATKFTRLRERPYPEEPSRTIPEPEKLAPDVAQQIEAELPSARTGAGGVPGDASANQVEPTTHWVEIELLDEKNEAIPNEAFIAVLPDGREVRGRLDGDGFARLDDFSEAGTCSICFPDLDKDDWEPLDSLGAKATA